METASYTDLAITLLIEYWYIPAGILLACLAAIARCTPTTADDQAIGTLAAALKRYLTKKKAKQSGHAYLPLLLALAVALASAAMLTSCLLSGGVNIGYQDGILQIAPTVALDLPDWMQVQEPVAAPKVGEP